jgi:hypothetical protein
MYFGLSGKSDQPRSFCLASSGIASPCARFTAIPSISARAGTAAFAGLTPKKRVAVRRSSYRAFAGQARPLQLPMPTVWRASPFRQRFDSISGDIMGKYFLAWLLGVPMFVLVIVYLFFQ